MNWIRQVVEAHKDSEAPERFFYWAAIASMSAVIKKNIWMNRGGFYKLYPNIYVFIIAKSGMKKGIPVNLTKKLVEKAECTRIIAGRTSVPRAIYDLGKMKTNENGNISKKAQALIHSGVLASFIVKDLDGLKILTDLYNTHEHEEKWENSLKGTGVDTLLEPCITLIGATNDDHFAETIPKSDVKGGFIARTFIVYSADRGTPNSLVDDSLSLVDLNTFCSLSQRIRSKLKGEFKWTKESGDWYRDWYMEFMKNLPEHDDTGYYNRVGDHIIKVGMLLSLSRTLKLEMDLDALQEAKAECMNCGRAAHQISMGGSSTTSGQTRTVMQALLSHPDHKLKSRTQILRKYWGDIDSYTIDLVAETLLGAGVINVEHFGKETIYTMKDVVVKEYLEYERRTRA